jgi:hypothetical protein
MSVIVHPMDGSKLATILLGTCCALIGACGRVGEKEICERYAGFDGPSVDPAWCQTWLRDWDTHFNKNSQRCLSQAKSRLEMRLCEFEDERGVTAYPFARRECALAAASMAEFEACAETAPIESEKIFAPIGPQPAAVRPATVMGLVHREQGWYALLLEPNLYVLSAEDEISLALVPVTKEGLGEAVWRIAPEGFRPSMMNFLIGDEFFAYLTLDKELRTIRLVEQALPEVTLKLEATRRIVAHALLPSPTGPRGVVVTQPQGPPRPMQGAGRADEKRGPVETWIPRFRLEPLGGVARTLVEYTEAEGSSADVEFSASAINYPGAHPALAWAGPYGENQDRFLNVALFDDDGTETFRTEIEGFEAVWLASTSDGITTVLAHQKFHSPRDMTVFRFSIDGELGRRRLNWRSPYHAVPIACRARLALVRVGAPGLHEGNHGHADYWDLSGRENLDLPERIWWGKRLTNVEVFAGCDGEHPAVAWISPQADGAYVDAQSPFDFSFMTLP